MRSPIMLWAGLLAGLAADAPASADESPLYNRDVRPILADACFKCHGPAAQKAGLRLDSAGPALKPAESGAVPIVPGNVDESEVIRRILSDDETEVMPPPSSKKTLTAEQKETLRRWVASGAAYQKHWAFEVPTRPAPPEAKKADGRTVAAIDAFLNDRLTREGLTPGLEADRPTLIRRVAFTLTGLPPTLAELDAYLGDTSRRAYENMVERYLNSPRFGEEMARHWLDVARYADTHGMHLDNERSMWPYRDWVVRAFNDGLPYDRFVVEQVAGDLLPNPTDDQLVATGFNRCNVTTGEGGSIDAEWHYRYAVDRASTVAEAFMGLTAGCAVCHDHKFDPISTEEFYKLYAFFYSAEGAAMDGNALLHEPTIRLAAPEQKTTLADLTQRLDAVRKAIASKTKDLAYRDPAEAEPAADAGGAKGPADQAGGDPSRSFRAWLKADGKVDAKDAKEHPAEIKALLGRARRDRIGEPGEAKLRAYYLQEVCVETRDALRPLLDESAAIARRKTELEAGIPATYIFRDMAKPRDAFVMVRGQYDKPGKPVVPGTPAVLPALRQSDPGARANRLDLAHWLVAPDHPLTARVAVNRFWQQIFGTGLVKTAYDFGTQGEPPSHPELLDWLAVEFRESGWDVKGLLRRMLTSDAFRRSAKVAPEALRRDPANRLYARGPRIRLDAEQVRDNALFVSGLIDLTMGGKGVRPYQPPNIWEPVAFTGSNTRAYVQDSGPALYRRSLYTFFKRTAPPPYLSNFDAPNREQFCTVRERSNTPLQALQLMNDVQHVEAARALAGRLWAEGGATPEARIDWGFRVVLSRTPDADERAVLLAEYHALRDRYAKAPADAAALIRVGESAPRAGVPDAELAALTMVANTLLNLDETINRN